MSIKVNIILPKTLIDDTYILNKKNLFFLAGPIKGGGDWQYQMVKELIKQSKEKGIGAITIVIPCSYSLKHPLRNMATNTTKELNGNDNAFDRAVTWERHYLERAAIPCNGSIIFWLPCESKIQPRNDNKPYGMDTRGELGEWRGRMKENSDAKYSVIIGAEPMFLGLSSLKRNFDDALGIDFPIHTTSEMTVQKALSLYQM